ncbi:MAG TPA: N-6 DNA methylase [Thermoanaerobaculia bacterium]|nr:N-6 DNA methylase [Thermoanaerobaculia bacterium]
MITSVDLTAGVQAIESLFRRLGYPARSREIDLDEWHRLGVGHELPAGSRLHHLVRAGTLDLFLAETPGPARDQLLALIRAWEGINPLHKCVVIGAHDRKTLSMFDVGPSGRARRLDIASLDSRAEVIDRLNLLELFDSQYEEVDVRELFDRALSREHVVRQFFSRFRSGVESAAEALGERAKEPEGSRKSQALLVLSRILFLYFVQQKGWLDHNRRFLIDHFQRSVRDGRDFHSTVLAPLFFGCLNTPSERRDAFASTLGRIPYLNGGLFERSAFELRHRTAGIPNVLAGEILEGVFERFTFSLDEGDDEGTHIDPEMLGMVFENLMAGEERLRSGTFYTPRPIVDRLAGRAIIEHCSGGSAEIRSQLECLRRGEPLAIDPVRAGSILERLSAISVLDPACGSGAFLLAALRAIEQLTAELHRQIGSEPPPRLRQRIVERQMYGVDLEPKAVRLCELRLWLAIVSRTDARIEDVPPLPNLDRNIMQGSSLLGPLDQFATGRRDIRREWNQSMRMRRQLVDEYRNAPAGQKPLLARFLRESDIRVATTLLEQSIAADEEELATLRSIPALFEGHEKADGDAQTFLRARIRRAKQLLRRTSDGELDYFSYDVHFAHVLAAGGFAIVLGNPPWVRSERIDPDARAVIARRYPWFRGQRGRTSFPQGDLSMAFLQRAIELAAPDGVVSMLLPAKVLNAGYAAALRRDVITNRRIVAIDDWSTDARNHFEADTFPLGLTIAGGNGEPEPRVAITTAARHFDRAQQELSSAEPGSPWNLLADDVARVVARLRRMPSLRDSLNRMPVMGVKTGANRIFFLDPVRVTSTSVALENPEIEIPVESVVRSVRGRDLQAWSATDSTWMLWPPAAGWSRPPSWAVELAQARGVSPRNLRLAYVRPEHLGIKVAWKDVSRGLCAAVLPSSVMVSGIEFPLVPNQTVYSIDAASLDEAHLLAALFNSSTFNALAVAVAERAKDFHYRYFASTIATLPFPPLRARSEPCRRIIRLARRASALRGKIDQAEIDVLVAELYGITPEEQAILEAFLRESLGR